MHPPKVGDLVASSWGEGRIVEIDTERGVIAYSAGALSHVETLFINLLWDESKSLWIIR